MTGYSICRLVFPGILMLLPVLTGCNPHLVNQEISPLEKGGNAYSLSVHGIEQKGRWWEALNDSYLNVLIEEAISGSLTLMQVRTRIEQAVAEDIQAASFLYPELSGKASGKKEWDGRDKPEDTFNASLALSWEMDLWGRLSSAGKASVYEVMAAREELEAAAFLLSSQVAETYFSIIEQNLQLSLLSRQIEAGERLLELIELRFGYGEASVVDVFQQRQQLASTHAQVPVVQSQQRTLINRLYVQMGRAPESNPPVLADNFPELPSLPSTGVPGDLLKNRPDLRNIFNKMIAIDYRVAEAVADRLPKIQLNATAGFTDRFSAADRLIIILLEAAAPVFDGDRRRSEVEKRKAIFKEELAKYSHAYITAIEEVENALWQEHHQLDLMKALEHQAKFARANLAETRNRYRQGLTDYLPVLTALQSLQFLERNILANQRELVSTRILLYRALGGSVLMAENHGPTGPVRTNGIHLSEGVVK